MVHRAGWWTYRWCHEEEIRQFHVANDGAVETDWSLGTFDAKKSEEEVRTMMAGRGWDAKSAGVGTGVAEEKKAKAEKAPGHGWF